MQKKKTIAIVAQGLNGGGAERVASIIANYIYERKEYNVIFVCAYNDIIEYDINENIKIEFIHTNKKNGIFRLIDRNRKIKKIMKKNKVDLIISFVTNEVLLSQTIIPTIHTLRNDPVRNEGSFISSKIRNYAYKHAKHIVFQTKGAQDYFCKDIKNKSSIIYNPIDTNQLPKWNPKNSNFIMASRLEKQKNIPLAINSFISVHSIYPNYSLMIYGTGTEKENLEKIINENNAKDYIKLCGRSNCIHKIMSESYAFLLSSDYEGISNSMLEALCIGIPCISTDSPPGGAREFIQDEVNGFLTKVGDVESLTNTIIKLIKTNYNSDYFYLSNNSTRKNVKKDNICSEWYKIIQKNI